jgi:pyruvate ferredoxin oxidoreductase delta subunit
MSELTSKDIELGFIVTEPGNAAQYRTGDWRTEKPVLDHDECTKCGLCYIYCPEGCIKFDDENFEADLFYCKGCGICAKECPQGAIRMVEEVE